MYLNGVQYGAVNGHNTQTIKNQRISIGSCYQMNVHYFPGMLDEVRFSNTVRSSDWIWACYENQRADTTFVSYGEAVSQVPQGTIYIFW